MDEPETGAPKMDELLDELRRRVAERRASGEYPEDLEQNLDAHFRRIAVHRRPPFDFDDLKARLREVEAAMSFTPQRIELGSRAPGGAQLHRTVSKIVSRQTQGVLEQVQTFADALRPLLSAMIDALESPESHQHVDLVGQMDALFERFAGYERSPSDPVLADAHIRHRLDVLEAAERKRSFRPWFSNEKFEEEFRGHRDELLERYESLAARFSDCVDVVDIGCGRGEFLDLLIAQNLEATGVEIDSDLVFAGRERGLSIEHGDAVSWLRGAPDTSVGGISLIQVVEHLSPQEVVDVVALSAGKLRPGGRIVIETVNPQSLYVYAHSFYLDPTHQAPVHPAYLHFLCKEAGFSEVEVEWRSPPPEADRLESLDGEASSTAEANIERLNRILFAAQDYAIIATL